MNIQSFLNGKNMARPRDKAKPAQIIDAAFDVFGEIGYEATVIKDIAERAGISTGTIYTYFSDKKDLFRSTARLGWSRFLAETRAIVEAREPLAARVDAFIETGFANLKRSLPLLRGMLFESSQMNILQESIGEFCALVDKLVADRPSRPVRAAEDGERRRALIRVIVVGVLFSAAMADPSRVDDEMEALKRTILVMISGG
jgi:AcrR family transcriptional regulator